MQTMANTITAEATRSNQDSIGHPLPLASTWVTGNVGTSDGPDSVDWRVTNQLALIGQGHYLMPVVDMPTGNNGWATDYFLNSFQTLASLHLPFTLKATQFEYALSNQPYLSLPASQNPNVVLADGVTVQQKVSPFGPLNCWYQVGSAWTSGTAGLNVQQLESWYPDPPKIVFLSNNEQPSLAWTDLPNTWQYVTTLCPSPNPPLSMEQSRVTVGNGYISCYRSLQQGMRDGLNNSLWKSNSIFVGYDSFGPDFMGRYGDWTNYSLYSKNIPRIDPSPLEWDGGSPSYYTNDWDSPTDYTVLSPQVSFQNYIFMQNEAWTLNPNFWYEFSVWDGFPGKYDSYKALGQTYDPDRYGGWVQFGMWLTRPRVVREWREWTTPYNGARGDGDPNTYSSYYMAIIKDVDLVYNNPSLTSWWRTGTLVPNTAHPHPFQYSIPTAYQSVNRWFMLDCNQNPNYSSWGLSTTLKVFALAYTKGITPNRSWLLYAHAPLGDLTTSTLVVPSYQTVTVPKVAKAGSFYLVSESTGEVKDALNLSTYTLAYTPGNNGTILGSNVQVVSSGGSGSQVTASPNTGYHFTSWSDGSTINPRVDNNITTNLSVSANFQVNSYVLSYSAGPNGSLSGNNHQTVIAGGTGTTVIAVPNAGYQFLSWSDGSLLNPRSDLNVMSSLSVIANFSPNSFTLVYLPGIHGSLSGTTVQKVPYGKNAAPVTALPNTGYFFLNWSDGKTTNPRIDLSVLANTTTTAVFTTKVYTLSYQAGTNGNLSGMVSQKVNSGGSGSEVLAIPNSGYSFVGWSDGSFANPRIDVTVSSNVSVTANFQSVKYAVSYAAGPHGTIGGKANQTISAGGRGMAILATPARGYVFTSWSDGRTDNPRKDSNITSNINVTAHFSLKR
jgi:uncharacterized repeat protein (TIGR02543 family)